MAEAALSRVGSVLDAKYELVRRIGAGGMSEVYEAKHLRLQRRVAIKFLLQDLATRPELIVRFRNEARAAGSLQHENIAAVYDVGELPDGMQYLVMELLSGSDCAAALEAETRFDATRAAGLIIQVCRGLSVAHAHGIVHRDLKPANLFLSQRADGSELIKLLDFGIAKLRLSPDAELSTGTGAALGTPCYMSPEQARGDRDIDARADIYAAGVILYELLTGQRPFDGSSNLQVLHRILTQPLTPVEALRNDLPAGLCAVVKRALSKEREQRYPSAAQLMAALQPFVGEPRRMRSAASFDETQPDPDPESKLRRRDGPRLTLSTPAPRRTAPLAWLALGVAGLLASGAAWRWYLLRAPFNPQPSAAAAGPVASAHSGSATLAPAPASERSDARPDAGSATPPQPSAAVVEAAAARRPPVAPRTRPVKRPAALRAPSQLEAPPPEPLAPEPPAHPSDPGRLKIDHSNPYQ